MVSINGIYEYVIKGVLVIQIAIINKRYIMSKLIFLMILSSVMLISNLSFSQNEINDGDYIKNDKINKFVGRWQWISGDTLFIIVFEKEKMKLKSDNATINADALKGWHQFTIGEKEIENTILSDKKSMTGIISRFGDENKLNILFRETTKSKSGDATLELLPGEKDKARWVLKEKEGIIFLFPGETYDHTFTVPTNVVMERVRNKNK